MSNDYPIKYVTGGSFLPPLDMRKYKLVDAAGKAIASPDDSEEEQESLETSLVKSKLNIFKSNQVSIIEKLQARLLEEVEKNGDPYNLSCIADAMQASIITLNSAEDLYPGAY